MAETELIRKVKTYSMFAAFLTAGMTMGIVGPTILDLQCALGVSYEEVIRIVPAKSMGGALGSLTVGFFYDRFNPLLTIAAALATVGLTMIVTPWSATVITLLVLGFLCNMAASILASTSDVFMLYLWGKNSLSYMQALNFCYGFGGLLAPLLASFFLSVPEELLTGAAVGNITISNQPVCDPEQLRIYIPYAVMGTLSIIAAIIFLYLYWYHGETAQHSSRLIDEGVAKARNFVWQKRIVVTMAAIFLLTAHGLEVGMDNFLASFAVMSDLHLTKQAGAYMTSLFWLTITFFRLMAIFFIGKVGAFYTIIFDLVILVAANIFLVPFGNSVAWCLWLGVALMGMGVSSIWASVFSLMESHFPVTSGVACFLIVSSSLTASSYPTLMAYAIQLDTQLFLYLLCLITVMCVVFFVILTFRCRKLRKHL